MSKSESEVVAMEYVKIKGASPCKCTIKDHSYYVDIVRSETCPDGYYPVVKGVKPTDFGEDGFLGFVYTIDAENDCVRKEYFVAHDSDVRITVTYSKLKLITAAKSVGKWDALKAWISASGYSDEWAACMYLASDYPGFDQIKAALVASGIVTSEEVEAILAAAEDDTLRMD